MSLVRLARGIDASLTLVCASAKWLVLPLVALLFLQWPLREIIQAYSRQANDLGQIFFALYIAVAVTAATRRGAHLAADMLARGYTEHTRRRLAKLGAALALLPWSVFVLVSGRNLAFLSLKDLEAFPDTFNPGYFLVKSAMWLLALLVFLDAILTLLPLRRHRA